MPADTRPAARLASPRPLGLIGRLAALFRTYAVPADTLVLEPPFVRDDRLCWLAEVPAEWESDANGASRVVLFEDGQPLGPDHVGHDDIRTLGRGRYSHWNSSVFFSTSDNSDPNLNGRIYSVRPPPGWEGRAPEGSGAASGATAAAEPPARPVRWATHILPPSAIEPRDGLAFVAQVPADWPADDVDISTLVLFEDDQPLPRPHATHDEIATQGGGRYSHWNGAVLFSASDGSDPRSNGRRYVAAHAEALVLGAGTAPKPTPAAGLCWAVHGLPRRWVGDDAGSSRVLLMEDGRPLGPAHALHEDIRTLGGGRFSHWGRALLFSTSDGSDPCRNGRTYTIALADESDGGAGNPSPTSSS